MNNVTIIGVCGGSASGKTTIVDKLKKQYDNDLVVLGHDFYYKAHNELSYSQRAELNYDHPSAFDTDRLIEDIKKLKNGEEIYRPVYDYTIHNRSDEVVLVKPKPVIVVEGILILENKELRDMMDIKVFVETDADERILRRIQRDVMKRGRSLESVINQYRDTVKIMHDTFIEPSKKYADIIIPRGGQNIIGIEMLMNTISRIVKSHNKKIDK
ncbi:uridine kinase [Helcococcus ovis]|uniref:Uridine kinase n=4 Tax=Bacteria TaxID=2 RepID=A0A4R9C494_9FIRM|nr:uridine kinase [Helcococcus ovis]TFF66208.1 uridine kinase [Helcococcus ovis]TFF67313.1 uridine kinase [Helcococcus ovis]WNZ00965.1 uridine kinase [Helcococcus ovis]